MSTTKRERWVEEIAKKTGKNVDEIDALLKRHRIEPRLTHAIPKRLQLLALKFDGEKTGDYETKAIQFSKTDLDVGLHAFVSSVNFKGKTSLLKIIRWALTGTRKLPTDMAGWFRALSLRFRLDQDEYEVRLHDAEVGSGELIKFTRDREFAVAEFEDMKSFSDAMDYFFLQELGLETLETFAEKADGTGVEQRHGWNWLSSAMWIDPNPVTLFGGDDITHNKPTRMMQMYLGLPWIMTRASLMDARKKANHENTQKKKAAKQVSEAAKIRLASLGQKREKLLASRAKETPLAILRERHTDALRQYSLSVDKVRQSVIAANEIETARRLAEEASAAATRELNAFVESQAAGHIFRRLSPVSCPSCEEVYSDEVRDERQRGHDCVVCGRSERREADDTTGVETALREVQQAAKEEVKRLRSRLVYANKRKVDVENERVQQDLEARRIEKEIERIQSLPDGEIEILKLDAQIQELQEMIGDEPESDISDTELLLAAINATKKMYEEEQNDLLKRVSDKTAEFARAFGMTDLVSVRLKGNTHMDIVMKGGTKIFGGCADGEKLRLKLASTLAMIHVAEESGIGRHPGVLLIDSVGSHEVVIKDVSEIVTGLANLSDALPSIQIFIAGIQSDAILTHVPRNNVVHNREDGYLW